MIYLSWISRPYATKKFECRQDFQTARAPNSIIKKDIERLARPVHEKKTSALVSDFILLPSYSGKSRLPQTIHNGSFRLFPMEKACVHTLVMRSPWLDSTCSSLLTCNIQCTKSDQPCSFDIAAAHDHAQFQGLQPSNTLITRKLIRQTLSLGSALPPVLADLSLSYKFISAVHRAFIPPSYETTGVDQPSFLHTITFVSQHSRSLHTQQHSQPAVVLSAFNLYTCLGRYCACSM